MQEVWWLILLLTWKDLNMKTYYLAYKHRRERSFTERPFTTWEERSFFIRNLPKGVTIKAWEIKRDQ